MPNGAFATNGQTQNDGNTNSGAMDTFVNFFANRCSVIYGNSDTVQPVSYRVHYIIKY